MSSTAKVVDSNKSKKTKVSLKKRLLKHIKKYLFLKLNEALVLGLVHSGFEPIAGARFIYFKKTQNPLKSKIKIDQIKIKIINLLLMWVGEF